MGHTFESRMRGEDPPRILRVYYPESHEIDDSDESQAPTGLSPRMRLSEFFETYYLRVVAFGERDNREATVAIHRDAVRWWCELTGDPPLCDINAYLLADFQVSLRSATYKRSKLGQERPLSQYSQRKIIRTLRSIFYRTGPTTDPKRPAAELLPQAPYLKMPNADKRPRPKRCFTLEQARQIVKACRHMSWGQRPGRSRPPATSPADWWRAFIMLHFYTGLRAGTVLNLRWAHVVEREDGPWLEVSGDAATKKWRSIDKPLHAAALAAVRKIRSGDGWLLPRAYGYRHLVTMHNQLQTLAGIPEAERLSPQAWRRTHGTEMGRLGAQQALRVAQLTLDHADTRTTEAHYVNLEAYLIRQLPLLEDPDEDNSQLRLF